MMLTVMRDTPLMLKYVRGEACDEDNEGRDEAMIIVTRTLMRDDECDEESSTSHKLPGIVSSPRPARHTVEN